MTAARATAPRSGDQPSTRDRLVELAAELFAERGYSQTSVRDISRRAAMTTGAIYGHFRNKAELLAEAISAATTDQLESQTLGLGQPLDYIETLTRLAREYPKRRQLRALIVQGAAAAQTDEETRTRLRDEQLAHFRSWVEAYAAERDRMGLDPSLDLEVAVLHTWAVELGLGVLESLGIEPKSKKAWADVQNRVARSLQLPPDDHTRSGKQRSRRA
jgi:AcrR family transcriptional regulator